MYLSKRKMLVLLIIIIIMYNVKEIIYFKIDNSKKTAILDWRHINTSRNISEYIFPNSSSMLIRPEKLCELPALLMVIICSAPPNFENRNAIRESWGFERNISEAVVKVYFLLGRTVSTIMQHKIEEESGRFRDIIQENFIDTYNNLTLKSLMLLKLVKNDCWNTISYVMKTDDDMYVNLVHLVKTLLTRNSTSRVLIGRLLCDVKPDRRSNSKWYVPKYMYSGTIYPNYLFGSGYVMSVDVSKLLFETALRIPLVHIEDIYLTGICANIANVSLINNEDFHRPKVKFNPCVYRTLITVHNFTPVEMRQTHFSVQNTDLEKACRAEEEVEKL